MTYEDVQAVSNATLKLMNSASADRDEIKSCLLEVACVVVKLCNESITAKNARLEAEIAKSIRI